MQGYTWLLLWRTPLRCFSGTNAKSKTFCNNLGTALTGWLKAFFLRQFWVMNSGWKAFCRNLGLPLVAWLRMLFWELCRCKRDFTLHSEIHAASSVNKMVKLGVDVYPKRIAPMLMVLNASSSSWGDLLWETHFVFRPYRNSKSLTWLSPIFLVI